MAAVGKNLEDRLLQSPLSEHDRAIAKALGEWAGQARFQKHGSSNLEFCVESNVHDQVKRLEITKSVCSKSRISSLQLILSSSSFFSGKYTERALVSSPEHS